MHAAWARRLHWGQVSVTELLLIILKSFWMKGIRIMGEAAVIAKTINILFVILDKELILSK